MKTYTKEQILLAAKIGQIPQVDASQIIANLDKAVLQEAANEADEKLKKQETQSFGKVKISCE